MKEKVVVALDLGTTGNRAIAFSKTGAIAAKSYYEFPQIFPNPGWVEHNPMDILDTCIKTLKDVINTAGAANIDSIGITNQRETTIIWDKNTGRPVYNAIVWQCRRTEGICSSLKEHKKVIKHKTGLFLDPYFSATKIKWIFDNVGGVKEKALKGELLFGTPETWILWNLTGKKVHATEPSNASRTLLFNIKTLEFDDELLKIFNVPKNILPEVKDSDSLFGFTDTKITGAEIPIHGILGDQQASLFAHCGWEDGLIKATYGTGIFILTGTKEKLVKSGSLITTVAWKTGKTASYALEGSVFMGGASIQWLRDNLKIISSASETEETAGSLNDNEGVYFVPAFQGLGAPYWDPDARGLLIGLTRKSSRANIVRAVVESLAYQAKDVMETMKKDLKDDFKVLRVDGGACANNFLMQFQADILSLPVERPKALELTALGAAGISAIGSGFWDRKDLVNIRNTERKFIPVMDKKKAEIYYQKWKDAVERSKKWN
ncbi:MAG: glycerol kinase GlpK [Elusimicrobia bacterium]|nr:glycerol kinase GlpK [Candidatus Liberimonas magnetica]